MAGLTRSRIDAGLAQLLNSFKILALEKLKLLIINDKNLISYASIQFSWLYFISEKLSSYINKYFISF